VTDERFKASVEAIYNQTDDCIFFSRLLADDLLTYGNRLRRKNAWKYRLGIPKMKDADWSTAEGQGLLPTNEAYASWLGGFRTEPTIWQRAHAWRHARTRSANV
jgi:hypothetical protein